MNEILKIANNGQWSLQKNWNSKQKQSAADWADSGMRRHLDKLPKATGKLRSQMLEDMEASGAESRVHPKTGEKEFRMYRNSPENDKFHTKEHTSWTTNPDFSYYWAQNNSMPDANDLNYKPKNQQVMHAWIPESKIHSFLPTTLGPMGHEKTSELEAIVEPHKVNVDTIHTGNELANQIKKRRI